MRMLMSVVFVLVTMAWAAASFAAEPMGRNADTGLAWDIQQQQAEPAAGMPYFTGAYVWSGRADRDYKPFFQWEFRLKGGEQAIDGVQVRAITLGPDLKPLHNGKGHWHKVGRLAAGAEVDWSYKVNTSMFSVYRIEMKWRGGKQSYFASDKASLPQLMGELDKTAQLVVVDTIFDRAKNGTAEISYWLRNAGGVAAEGVEQTIVLRDEKGAAVFEHAYTPEDGTIPAGYAKQQKIILKKTPKFATVQVKTATSATGMLEIDGGSFTNAAEIEVAHIVVENGVVRGKVRNGTKEPYDGLVVTLQFVTADGGDAGRTETTIAQLPPGAVQDFAISNAELQAFVGWEVAFAFAEQAGAAADVAGHTIAVDKVEFVITEAIGADGVLKIRGTVYNKTGGSLQNLALTFSVAQVAEPAKVSVGDLAHGEEYELSFVVLGVEALAGIGMRWSAGVSE